MRAITLMMFYVSCPARLLFIWGNKFYTVAWRISRGKHEQYAFIHYIICKVKLSPILESCFFPKHFEWYIYLKYLSPSLHNKEGSCGLRWIEHDRSLMKLISLCNDRQNYLWKFYYEVLSFIRTCFIIIIIAIITTNIGLKNICINPKLIHDALNYSAIFPWFQILKWEGNH